MLVAAALAGAGASFFVIEDRRIATERVADVEQELDEFRALAGSPGPYSLEGELDPTTQQPPTGVADLLLGYIQRNVPTDDELLVGWWDDAAKVVLAAPETTTEAVVAEPAFLAAVRPLVADGGNARIEVAGRPLLVTVQPARVALADGTSDPGALVVVTFTDVAERQLRETVETYAVVSVLALVVVVAVAALQSGRLLRPLRVLRRSAEEIGETDLSRRVPETGNDDITALTRTVNGMLARLERAFVTQRQFLDDAGHELRTPLTILRGHLELLDVRDPEDVATRDLLLEEVDRMSRLVSDLLVLAKSDRPDFLSPGPVEVDVLVASVHAKARALAERRWLLETPPEPVGVVVEADEQRLTQALLQLCDNAAKHTGRGDEVAVGYAADDAGGVRLWVRDTGPGVPAADRGRIFERFGRSVVAPDDEGFGLGLSIVSAIVAAHGGTITVEDAAPRGARFVVTLRTVRPAEEPDESPWRGPSWPAS